MNPAPASEGPEREVVLIRHGETEWSRTGRHTSVTDLPLTEDGQRNARLLEPWLAALEPALVLSSPRLRARETCEQAGLGRRMAVDDDLREWDYGEYEGLTSHEIQSRSPGWMLFTDGCPGGESPTAVGVRVDRVIARTRATPGQTILFAHGHFLRVLAARWIGLPVSDGRHFLLDTATVSILGYYRSEPAVKRWNAPIDDGNTSEKKPTSSKEDSRWRP